MKKIIAAVLIIFMAATLCLAQPVSLAYRGGLDRDLDEIRSGGEWGYGSVSLCYSNYETAADLTNIADHIYKGTVVGISFEIRPFNEEKMLFTVYEVQVQTSYKGKLPGTVYIRIAGGLPGYREAEQRALAEDSGGCYLTSRCRCLSIGKSYLFCTRGKGEKQGIVNLEQFAISKESPNYKKMLQYVILSRWFDFEGLKNHLELEHRKQQLELA